MSTKYLKHSSPYVSINNISDDRSVLLLDARGGVGTKLATEVAEGFLELLNNNSQSPEFFATFPVICGWPTFFDSFGLPVEVTTPPHVTASVKRSGRHHMSFTTTTKPSATDKAV